MRLRSAAAAAVSSLALLLSLSGTASAATGHFSYTYLRGDGVEHTSLLEDPENGVCITLPEVADPATSPPAYSPTNDTNATAVVYTEPDCTGDQFSLRPNGGHASARLKLRSVGFS